ncbi:MAG: peptide deformylase [Flavobacteriia bacterium]|nr:peptide deformylase [Flavobacteriia bacterium]
MILPIVAYGDPVLKKRGENLEKGDPNLPKLVEDMFETMYAAHGVGLAAPQVGKSLRMFVVDASPFAEEGEEDYEALKDFKKVFVNPEIIEEDGDEWAFSEGCLSIPEIHEDVYRHESLRIKYFDENWDEHEEELNGLAARVVQHEYDHIEGVLFVEHLSPLRRRMLKGKLQNITKGKINVDYRMKFPKK